MLPGNSDKRALVMDIKEKLRFIEQIQKPSEHRQHETPLPGNLEQVLSGELIATDHGIIFVRTKKYDVTHEHGLVTLGEIDHVSPYFLHLAGKDDNLKQIDLRRSLFFDTETTGLAGGSGTHIFLTGLGYFEDDQFIIKQFFLRDFPDEPAMLHAIHDLFSQFHSLVSFNGKSFDLPLLRSRFIYHRVQKQFVDPPHLDLLHAARRVWKHRLQDCSLANLEARVIQVRRHNDIPSYLIPQLYFAYLRNKNALPLQQVFYHNEIDILSLVSLTIMLDQIHKQPLEALSHHLDLKTLARHYENTHQWQRNISIYQFLFEKETDKKQKTEIGIRLGYCYKRLGNWNEAVGLWQQLLDEGSFRPEPYEELAKYYEHQVGDLDRAEHVVVKARGQGAGESGHRSPAWRNRYAASHYG